MIFTAADLIDPGRFHFVKDNAQCICGHQGLEVGETDDGRYLFVLMCPDCGSAVELVKLPPELILANVKPSKAIPGAESHDFLVDRLTAYLKPHFVVVREVHLRHRDHLSLRCDAVAVPKTDLARQGFPFPFVVIEIKPAGNEMQARPRAYDQCDAYLSTTLNDKRLAGLRAESVECVALYQGRMTNNRHERPESDPMGQLERHMGRKNIGELVHDSWHGLALLISEECIWGARVGVTGVGVNWPVRRQVAWSRKREEPPR